MPRSRQGETEDSYMHLSQENSGLQFIPGGIKIKIPAHPGAQKSRGSLQTPSKSPHPSLSLLFPNKVPLVLTSVLHKDVFV